MTGSGAGGRVAAVLAQVVSAGPRRRWPAALVELCRAEVGADGVALALADATGPVAVAAATAGMGQQAEDLQFSLGEGPCRLATETGRVVRVADLSTDDRWVEYGRAASQAGVVAVVSLPLLVGAVRVGVLDVYCGRPGPLTAEQTSTVLVHAEAATAVLLLLQVADEAADDAEVHELADIRPVVHQAAGMVAIQLGVDLGEALVRLRGHAFGSGLPLREVARQVVTRQLVLDRGGARDVTNEGDDDERT